MEDQFVPKRLVIYWLYLGIAMVLGMVVIGGVTRLTHSGLSMTNPACEYLERVQHRMVQSKKLFRQSVGCSLKSKISPVLRSMTKKRHYPLYSISIVLLLIFLQPMTYNSRQNMYT